MSREDAYRVVQGHAMEAWKTEGDFRARVAADPACARCSSAKDLDEVFRLERYLGHVDAIFARVFAPGGRAGVLTVALPRHPSRDQGNAGERWPCSRPPTWPRASSPTCSACSSSGPAAAAPTSACSPP